MSGSWWELFATWNPFASGLNLLKLLPKEQLNAWEQQFPLSVAPETLQTIKLVIIVAIVIIAAILLTWFVWRWITILKEVGLIGHT